jgi:hypothetical protein
MGNSRVLLPHSGSDFNHLTGEGESLLKMMQERGRLFLLIQSISMRTK